MKKLLIISCVILILFIGCVAGFYVWGIGAKNTSEELVSFVIESGTTKMVVAKNLENAGLIRSQYALDIYLFFEKANIQAGEYELSANMTPLQMLEKFVNGDVKIKSVTVTLLEGQRITDYAETLAKNFDFTKQEFLNQVNNVDYLNELLTKEDYWFLTSDILNTGLYYPLEGYLFPDTYEFLETATPKEIIETLLDHTNTKLTPLKETFESSSKSVHEILTLASIVENEAITTEDREKASQVFYKRMEIGMPLQSDITSYYGARKELGSELTSSDLNNRNPYNTRLTDGTMNGKLPIGPVSNPSLDAITAALSPTNTNYIYFVANVCTGEVFFFETWQEFYNKVIELQGVCDKN